MEEAAELQIRVNIMMLKALLPSRWSCGTFTKTTILPLLFPCLLVCAFLFFNFSYNSSGQEIMWIFPQAGLKPTGNMAFLVL